MLEYHPQSFFTLEHVFPIRNCCFEVPCSGTPQKGCSKVKSNSKIMVSLTSSIYCIVIIHYIYIYVCVCVWYIMVYSISVCVCVYVSKYVNTCSNGRLSFLVPLSEVKHQPQWRVQANCQKLQSLLCSTGVHTWSFHHGKMRFNYKVEQVEPHR